MTNNSEPDRPFKPYVRPGLQPSWPGSPQQPGYSYPPSGQVPINQSQQQPVYGSYSVPSSSLQPSWVGSPQQDMGEPPELDDDDDVDKRRSWKYWAVGGAVVIAILMLVSSLLGVIAEEDQKTKDSTTVLQGHISQYWQSSGQGFFVTGMAATDDVLITVECKEISNPAILPTGCELVGRDITTGEQRWIINDGPVGTKVAVVGRKVVTYGGERSLIVNPNNGHVTKTLSKGVLLANSAQTAVLVEEPAPGRSDGARLVAVAVDSGAEVWQDSTAAGVLQWYTARREQQQRIVPAGFDPAGYGIVANSTEYIAVPNISDPYYTIRAIKDGRIIAQSTYEDAIVGVIGDLLLRVTGAEGQRRVEVATVGAQNPRWTYEIDENTTVGPCADMVCVTEASGKSVVLAIDKGEPVLNGINRLFVHRVGKLLAVVRCGKSNTQDDPCPLNTATTEVRSLSQSKTLWKGSAPAFVATIDTTGRETLIIGTTRAGSERATVVAFSQSMKQINLGQIKDSGLVNYDEIVGETNPTTSPQVAQKYVSRNQCLAYSSDLLCASQWTPEQLTSWRWQASSS